METPINLHEKVLCPHCGIKAIPKTIGKSKEVSYLSKCIYCCKVWLTYVKTGDGMIIFAVPPLNEGSPYNRQLDDALTMRDPKFFIQPTGAIS